MINCIKRIFKAHPVISRYSVSLVYAKYHQEDSNIIEYTTILRVLITDAYSKEEALGKALGEFNETEKESGFKLINSLVLPVYKQQ
jgi:hypothetical protein